MSSASEESRVKEPIETPVKSDSPSGWAPAKKPLSTTLLLSIVALAGVLVVLYAWKLPPFTSSTQSTDNAYVRGQTTLISPQVSGYISRVAVQDYLTVKTDQVLIEIDNRSYQQRVELARAHLNEQFALLENNQQDLLSRQAAATSQAAALDSAQAQLSKAQSDLRRIEELIANGWVSPHEREQAQVALRAAEAGVNQAKAAGAIARQDIQTVKVARGGLEAAVDAARAQLKLAEIDLDNTVIRAPVDGQLGAVGPQLGQYVTAGSQLMFLIPRQLWVTANFKEGQTAHMAPGQPATFTIDALNGAQLSGHVERIAPATGSEFAVIKADNATGNFVKVAQRIPVRIAIDPNQPLIEKLRPGISVEVAVDTSEQIDTAK